jgi:regulator of protease activity HflC (stomatin/prohibitin superfamily)
LRGSGWINANGCCEASAHRSARLAVDGSHLVNIETFAIDWIRLVPNNLNQAFKDEAVKFKAVDIAPNRETIRTAVLKALRSRLSPYSIRVNDLNIDNISFSRQFEQAIEAKQEATQAALRAKAQVQQAQFEAQSRVAKAKGEADANVTVAQGQAEANRKLNASLSANVLQYIAIQKLSPLLRIAVLPSGSGTLIGMMLRAAKPVFHLTIW